MFVDCAWHKQYFGVNLNMREIEPFENKEISHGLCPNCKAIVLFEDKSLTFEKEISRLVRAKWLIIGLV